MIIDTKKVEKAIKYNTAYFLSQHINMTRNNIGFYKRGEKDIMRLNLKSASEIQEFYDEYMTIKKFYFVGKNEVIELSYSRELMNYTIDEVPIETFDHRDYKGIKKVSTQAELENLVSDLEEQGLERGTVDEMMINWLRKEKE